jgi:hypothetical protein
VRGAGDPAAGALGWIYLPVTQADLSDPVALLADLRTALARRA